MSEPDSSPALDRPGAGLPAIEKWIGRIVLKVGAMFTPTSRIIDRIATERDRLLELCHDLSANAGTTRVLVDRVRGIEDSSRHWSVFMTLEHLRLVNDGIVSIITALKRGDPPDLVVRIEDVKPPSEVGEEVISGFEESLVDLTRGIESQNRSSHSRHPHPWFGPLTAHQWAHLAAMHLGIHRHQIQRILELLPDTQDNSAN